MNAQDGETGGAHSSPESSPRRHRRQPEAPVFGKVSDRDLITLADLLCRSLEFHSMLVASKLITEVDARRLWPAVIDRRRHSIQLSTPDLSDGDAQRIATEQIRRFRNENFPVEPDRFDEDPLKAAERWNGYIAF